MIISNRFKNIFQKLLNINMNVLFQHTSVTNNLQFTAKAANDRMFCRSLIHKVTKTHLDTWALKQRCENHSPEESLCISLGDMRVADSIRDAYLSARIAKDLSEATLPAAPLPWMPLLHQPH